ncbi:MAG: leucyl aminopeptidase [Patescibacteria group bacterium]|nr:leucyl aminopeptidase [Patescibacteria group bacterium]
MDIHLTVKNPQNCNVELIVFFVTKKWQKEITHLSKNLSLIIKTIADNESFNGNKNQTLFVDLPSDYKKRLLLIGIEGLKQDTIYNLQNIIAKSIKTAKKTKRKKIGLSLHPEWLKNFSPEKVSKATAEAIYLSLYNFNKYKGIKDKKDNLDITLFVSPSKIGFFEKGINKAKIVSQAVIFTRDLINEPAEITTPSYLAKIAKNISKSKVKVEILNVKQMKTLGMNSILAVGKGSDSPPKFIKLTYKPKSYTRKKLVIIGKGITFDTGGLSLKPSSHMENMKSDMSGAAVVLGVFSQIAEVKPDCEVTGLIAACENMPSGKALRPGDIIKSLNGKTIEVLNTDAEGRLTLADALSYAVKFIKPTAIIDLATLTGAMMASLGQDIAGIFGNDKKMLDNVKSAARDTGELIWEMPLFEGYKDQIVSNIADLRNISKSRYGGAITAALFLKEFVDNTPWVHMDVAGPAFIEKDEPLSAQGGTGFGVRLLFSLIKNF